MFVADLIRAIHDAKMLSRDITKGGNNLQVKVDFVRAESYVGTSTSSSGNVKLTMMKTIPNSTSSSSTNLNRFLLIVDDIIDTGRTLTAIRDAIQSDVASDYFSAVRFCCLLSKPARRISDNNVVKADYVGFEIPDKFVVGYGLDFDERFRELPYIAVMNGS